VNHILFAFNALTLLTGC